ncbi:MAG: hypothetical protein J7M40_04825 [Planctomycetes bacterium]|nr:hypothetical protein [Planctomycetota bacterium]
MQAATDHEKNPPKRSRRFTVIKWMLIVTAGVVLAIIVILPAYLSSDSGKKLILSKISRAIDGQVDAKTLSVGRVKGDRLTDLTFSDDKGMMSVSVRKISAKPQLMAMLRGNLALGKTLLDAPKAVINIEDPGARTQSSKSSKSDDDAGGGAALGLAMLDMEVKEGSATINLMRKDSTQSVHFRNIESKVNLNPLGQKSTFALAMTVVEGDKESQITAGGSMKQSDKKKWTLKGTTGDFKVAVDKLELSTLTPLFALMGKDIQTSGQLNADADVRIEKGKFKRIMAKAQLRDFKRIVAGKETVMQEPVIIDADVSSTDGQIRIKRLNFESSFCNVRCSGTGNVVDYDADAELTGLQDFAGQLADFGKYRLQGKVASTGKVTFGENTVKLTGRGLTENMIIRKGDLATEPTTANLGFDIHRDNEKNITKIASAKMLADLGSIEITDAVIPGDLEQGTVSLGLSADVDLRKLQPFVALAIEIPQGVTFAGRLTSQAAIDGAGGRFHIKTDRTNVKKLVINAPGQEPFKQETIKLVADIIADTKQKEITVNDLFIEGVQGQSLIKVTKGRFEQSEKGQKTNVTGQLQAEYDLAAVSALAAPFLPRGLAMEGIRKSDLTFDSQYPTGTKQLLANINGQTDFGFDKAQYMGLKFGPANLKLQAEQGKLKFKLPPTTVNEGRVAFEGNVNFKEKAMTLRMANPSQLAENVKINDEMTRRMLMYINPLFANQAGVTGVASFHCEKMSIPLGSKTFADDLEITGTIEIADVVLKPRGLFGVLVQSPGKLHVLPTRFVLERGFLAYRDMPVHVGNNPLNFSGRIGLDKSIDMMVTFPWTFQGRTARIGDESAMRITAPIKGTLNNPTIDMNKVLEGAGQKLLEEQLKKALEKIFR